MTAIPRGGEYLHALETELYEFGHDDTQRDLVATEYQQAYETDPEASILSTFELCNTVIDYGYIPPKEHAPNFELTERTVNYALQPNKIETSADQTLTEQACLEAELRLLRSLSWHDGPEAEQLGRYNNAKPAAIFFDASGEPFAYQKASGKNTAHVWRSCIVEAHGIQHSLPADCFVSLVYPPAEDPRLLYSGTSLVAFEKFPKEASINVLRFSTFGLAHTLRVDSAYTVITRLGSASPQTISNRVDTLLRGGFALPVSHHY